MKPAGKSESCSAIRFSQPVKMAIFLLTPKINNKLHTVLEPVHHIMSKHYSNLF